MRKYTFQPFRAAFLLLILLPLSFPAQAVKQALVFGVHPYLHSTTLVERFTPLVKYLSEKLGRDIQMRVGTSYQGHIDAFTRGEIDFAYFGPAPFIKLTENNKSFRPLGRLSFSGQDTFRGAIIVHKDSDIKSLADLAGKSFAFGDPNSTLSSLVPRRMLQDAGVELEDLAGYSYLNNHHNVALAVLVGKYDAGGVKSEVFKKYQARGLQVLQWTPEIPTHLFVAGPGLDAAQAEQISVLLQSLKDDPRAKNIMQSIKKGTTAIIPASISEYEELRKLISRQEG